MNHLPLTLAAACLLLPVIAAAESPALRIDTIEQTGNHIVIGGIWPDGCTPQVVAQTSEDSALDVLLAASGSICARGPRPFTVEISQRDGFSPPVSRDRVRPLHVFAADGARLEPRLAGFRLLGGTSRAVHPDDGFWWPVDQLAGSGSVLSIESQGGALGVALLSYDDAGNAVWYFGTSQLEGSVAHVELARMHGGASAFAATPTPPRPQAALELALHFLSSTRAEVYLSRPTADGSVAVTTMTLARQPFSELPQSEDWLGPWLVAATDSDRPLPEVLVWTDSISLDDRHVRLLDGEGAYLMDCELGGNENRTAQSCVLRDRSDIPLVRFDEVGLQRLDGVRADGSPVILVRPR